MLKSTIPDEISALNLPDISETVVIGGAVMELLGLRKAGDIDMVVSLKNWQYLRDEMSWVVKQKFGTVYMQDPEQRFDVWRWWFDAESKQRVSIAKLKKNCVATAAGFYIPTVRYQIELKRQEGREKDLRDIALLDTKS